MFLAELYMPPLITVPQATARISSIASHLSNSLDSSKTGQELNAQAAMVAGTSRPPITCHILDTTTGTPAPDVSCTLTLTGVPNDKRTDDNHIEASFNALTNDDGRVTAWKPSVDGSQAAKQDLDRVLNKTQEMHWRITFEIGTYYKAKEITPFFNKVDVHFVTGGKGQEGREHYHVPLLVGPFNYTTYRGS